MVCRIAGPAAWPFVVAPMMIFRTRANSSSPAGWRSNRTMATAFEPCARPARQPTTHVAWSARWPGMRAQDRAPMRDWLARARRVQTLSGVSACIEHRVDPRQLLARLVSDPEPATRASHLRLAGKLRRADLAREIAGGALDADEQPRLWAAWALAELGSGDLARVRVAKSGGGGGPDAHAALRAAIKAAPTRKCGLGWGDCSNSPETAAVAVRGIGMLGDRTLPLVGPPDADTGAGRRGRCGVSGAISRGPARGQFVFCRAGSAGRRVRRAFRRQSALSAGGRPGEGMGKGIVGRCPPTSPSTIWA